MASVYELPKVNRRRHRSARRGSGSERSIAYAWVAEILKLAKGPITKCLEHGQIVMSFADGNLIDGDVGQLVPFGFAETLLQRAFRQTQTELVLV